MRTVGTAERAAFQTIFHRYVSPHSRVIKNKGEKFIFRNEAAMSSQVKVFRTMSRGQYCHHTALTLSVLWYPII